MTLKVSVRNTRLHQFDIFSHMLEAPLVKSPSSNHDHVKTSVRQGTQHIADQMLR